MERDNLTQYDRDNFNYTCRNVYQNWSEFVSQHYALSERDDSKYWRECNERVCDESLYDLEPTQNHGFRDFIINKMYNLTFPKDQGVSCISIGMNNFPLSNNTIIYESKDNNFNYEPYIKDIKEMDKRTASWNDTVKDCPSLFEYLTKEIYN